MLYIILLFSYIYAIENTSLDQQSNNIHAKIQNIENQKKLIEIDMCIHNDPVHAASLYIELWLETLNNEYIDRALDIYISKQLYQEAKDMFGSLQLLKDPSFNQGRLIFSWGRLLYDMGQNNNDMKLLTDSKRVLMSFLNIVGESNLDDRTRNCLQNILLSIDNILSESNFAQIVYMYNNYRDEPIVILQHCEVFLHEYAHSKYAPKIIEMQQVLQKIIEDLIKQESQM